ncbi:contactin-1-like isoform X2 [Saccostrea cucullata]|uniref:contactin-1-like isoform X2 n=1 Tax=Saccostrea cuccullata TaxID=36930 RepID=UPI002ED5B2DA
MESPVICLIFLCVRDEALFCKGAELINLPPVITSEFEPEYFVPIFYSTPLSLFCSAKYNVLRYQWHKNYSKIVENDRVSYNPSTGEIIFRNLEKEDFGVYYCTAQNKFGISVSLFVKLSEADLDQLSPISNVQQTCKEYHHCTLLCLNQPRCQPETECMIEWKLGYGTSESVFYNESVALDREGNLHFLNIRKSAGNKNYTCGIWNERINVYRLSSITYLQINESSKGISPVAFYQSGDKAFVGENATLLCTLSGNPVPKIEWRNNNGTYITTNDKYIVGQYGRRLQIINVTLADGGVYECKTNSNRTQNPFLNVTSPPLFPDVGKRFMTKILQNLTKESTALQCNTMSATAENDPIVIKWMKNGEILNKDVRYQLSEDNKTLHIYNDNSDDYGCYTCVEENSEGIAVANFLLPYGNLRD